MSHTLRAPRRGPARLLAAAAVAGMTASGLTGWMAIGPAPEAHAQPGGNPWTLYAVGATDVAAINVATNTADPTPIATGTASGSGIVVSPDGAVAFVTDGASGAMTPIDTTTNVAAPGAITVTGTTPTLSRIAITPDGATAYVVNVGDGVVVPVDLTGGPQGGDITPATSPAALAISPDGATLYVANGPGGIVYVVDTATGTIDPTTISVGAAGGPRYMAAAADGRTVWINSNPNLVPIDISVSPPTAGTPGIALGGNATAIAAAPEGDTVYVAVGTDVLVVTGGAVTATVPVGDPVTALAVTPDGRTVYAATNTGTGDVFPIDVTVPAPVAGGAISTGIGALTALAITPDQAPVAALAANVTQAPVTLDASASTVPYGTIVRYDWDFGDGTTGTSTTPTVSHAYASAGTYTARVTLTSSGGTSTAPAYTGLMTVRNGRASATTTASLAVAQAAVGPGSGPNAMLPVTGVATTGGTIIGAIAIAIGGGLLLLARHRRRVNRR